MACGGAPFFQAAGLAEGAPLLLPADPLRRCYRAACEVNGTGGSFTFCADARCSRGCRSVAFDNAACVSVAALAADAVLPRGVAAFKADCSAQAL